MTEEEARHKAAFAAALDSANRAFFEGEAHQPVVDPDFAAWAKERSGQDTWLRDAFAAGRAAERRRILAVIHKYELGELADLLDGDDDDDAGRRE